MIAGRRQRRDVEGEVQLQDGRPTAGFFYRAPLGGVGVQTREPSHASSPPQDGSGAVRGSTKDRGRRKVAIVEDERDALTAYSSYLQKLGYDSVSTFLNGEDFVQAVKDGSVSPELVLMDYRLPGEDGIEAAKGVVELRPGTRVIVTTADDSVQGKAQALGFHFLQKPFSLAALARMMDAL